MKRDKEEDEITDEIKDKIIYKQYIRDTIWSIICTLGFIADPLESGIGIVFKNINTVVWLFISVCSIVVLYFYLKCVKQAENKKQFWITYDLNFEIAVICLVVSIVNLLFRLCVN